MLLPQEGSPEEAGSKGCAEPASSCVLLHSDTCARCRWEKPHLLTRCLRPAEQAFGWEEVVATSSRFYPPTLSHGGPNQTEQGRLKRLLLSLERPRLDEILGLTTGLALFLISSPISSKKIKEQKTKPPGCHILHTLSLQSET